MSNNNDWPRIWANAKANLALEKQDARELSIDEILIIKCIELMQEITEKCKRDRCVLTPGEIKHIFNYAREVVNRLEPWVADIGRLQMLKRYQPAGYELPGEVSSYDGDGSDDPLTKAMALLIRDPTLVRDEPRFARALSMGSVRAARYWMKHAIEVMNCQ